MCLVTLEMLYETNASDTEWIKHASLIINIR